MKKLMPILGLTLLLFCPIISTAQGSEQYGKGLVIKLNEDGSRFLRFATWHQFWVHYVEPNEGSIRNGKPAPQNNIDFEIRRSRLLWLGQITPRYRFVTHIGINNQSVFSGGINASDGKKPQIFIHEAANEYTLFNKKNLMMDLGAGLHYWNGVSRMSNASTVSFLGIDAPIFNFSNIDQADQFARFFGIYLKGKAAKKIDYRLSINQPFKANTANAIATDVANYNPRNTSKLVQGYVSYQFLETEPHVLPYTVGSYIGTKRVLNVGAGFLHAPNMMWYKNTAGDTLTANQNLYGVDVFYDTPLDSSNKYCLTVYGVHYFYNYGPNYVRPTGIMNPAPDGGGPFRGNAYPTMGTGNISYIQAGLGLPKKWLKNKARLMPYVAYSYATFDGVRDANNERIPVGVLDAGLNLFLDGHQAKITFNYRRRPDFTNFNSIKYHPEAYIQFQVAL